jgi:hypothetical protein
VRYFRFVPFAAGRHGHAIRAESVLLPAMILATSFRSRRFWLFVALSVVCLYYVVSLVVEHPDKTPELLVTMIATGIAAYVGGWAAFGAERERRAEEELKKRVSASNKAIFVAFTIYESLDNLRKYYIDKNGARTSKFRALMIDSPQAGMMQSVGFDFDSLNFFLDADDDVSAITLMELQVLDWHFQMLRNTVELRTRAAEELHNVMLAQHNANIAPENIQTVHSTHFQKLSALTDQLVTMVDDGIVLAKKADGRLRAALALQFPNQDFLRVNYVEQAPAAEKAG